MSSVSQRAVATEGASDSSAAERGKAPGAQIWVPCSQDKQTEKSSQAYMKGTSTELTSLCAAGA